MSTKIDAYALCRFDDDRPSLYAYALHFAGSNSLMLGFGFESRSGLNRSHVCSHVIHECDIDDFIDQVRQGRQVIMETGTLAAHFDGAETINLETLMPTAMIAQLLSSVAEDAWNAPFGMAADEIALNEESFVWVLFDRSDKRFKIGYGVYGSTGDKITGETCYSIPVRDVERFCAEQFQGKAPLPMPMRAMTLEGSAPSHLTGDMQKLVAIRILRLFDLYVGGGDGA